MKIKYFNEFNDELTNNQINNSINYYKVYFDSNNEIVTKEYFENKILHSIYYFLRTDEIESEIIETLLDKLLTYIFIVKKSVVNDFSLESYNIYDKNNSLVGCLNKLYDQLGNVICDSPFIIETNQYDFSHTIKSYYDKNKEFETDLVFDASYDYDGSLILISYNPGSYQDDLIFRNNEDDIAELASLTEKSENFIRYYMNGNILPPPSN